MTHPAAPARGSTEAPRSWRAVLAALITDCQSAAGQGVKRPPHCGTGAAGSLAVIIPSSFGG